MDLSARTPPDDYPYVVTGNRLIDISEQHQND